MVFSIKALFPSNIDSVGLELTGSLVGFQDLGLSVTQYGSDVTQRKCELLNREVQILQMIFCPCGGSPWLISFRFPNLVENIVKSNNWMAGIGTHGTNNIHENVILGKSKCLAGAV